MLLECGIADAYGLCFEMQDPEYVAEHNTVERYGPGHKHPGLRPGQYSDDTQMSIAVAEAILSDEPWTKELLARKFTECFKRDPRRGYAGGFYLFLCDIQDGGEFLKRIEPTSERSGAAMRAAPCGFYQNPLTVKARAAVQAEVTHNTPNGVKSAVAVALAAHYFLYRLGPKSLLPTFLETEVPHSWSTPWTGRVKVLGMECAHAAVTAVVQNDTFSGILKQAVGYGGDVDTVAAIALSVAAGSEEVRNDLSARLVADLEDGPFGRSYLAELDKKLAYKFGFPVPLAASAQGVTT